jgi:hypothetical protein
VDLDGLEEKWVVMYEQNSSSGKPFINRNRTEIKVDRDAEIYNKGQRLAITHVTLNSVCPFSLTLIAKRSNHGLLGLTRIHEKLKKAHFSLGYS